MTGRLLSDDLLSDLSIPHQQQPMDSSRVLLGLMDLSRRAEAAEDDPYGDSLSGIISKGVLRSLLAALHYRDAATVNHVRRVAMLAVGMAQYLGWEGRHLKLLEVAALLHDIGKVGVPDNILFKPGRLSPDEAELMALHHNIGIDVLQACRVDQEVLEIVVQAHSQYGGADGLSRVGVDTHQGARILAVADAYDSLHTDQVYREGKPHDEIMKVLTGASGTQFDGNVVAALSRWIESEGLPFAAHSGHLGYGGAPQPPLPSEETLEAGSLARIFSYLYVLESLYDGFYLLDADLRFVVWNLGAEQFLGHAPQEMLGQTWTRRVLGYADSSGEPLPDGDCPLNQVLAEGKATTPTLRIRRRDGSWADAELQTVPLFDAEGRLQGAAEIFRDISRDKQRPREYRELKLAASRDALTSVANRGELENRLRAMMDDYTNRRGAEPFSVIFLDVDHFKNINDTWGHNIGDRVLIDMSKLVQHEMYSGELIGRYGGEEFLILCPATELEQAYRKAERLRIAMPRAAIGGVSDLQVTASFGVAQVEPDDTPESVVKRADKALYKAKATGRNRTCTLTPADADAQDDGQSGPSEAAARNPFLFNGTFHACIAADLVVYKLGGFVNDHQAKLGRVTEKQAVIQVGSRGLLPFWGGSEDRQPVELQVSFGRELESPNGFRASRQVEVAVRIRPIGWVRNPQVFEARARQVMKKLRAYFAAE